jgi:hypothetical protein
MFDPQMPFTNIWTNHSLGRLGRSHNRDVAAQNNADRYNRQCNLQIHCDLQLDYAVRNAKEDT